MKKVQTTNCDSCQDQFEQNVKRLVREGRKPTIKAHEEKKKEVTAAFHAGAEPVK